MANLRATISRRSTLRTRSYPVRPIIVLIILLLVVGVACSSASTISNRPWGGKRAATAFLTQTALPAVRGGGSDPLNDYEDGDEEGEAYDDEEAQEQILSDREPSEAEEQPLLDDDDGEEDEWLGAVHSKEEVSMWEDDDDEEEEEEFLPVEEEEIQFEMTTEQPAALQDEEEEEDFGKAPPEYAQEGPPGENSAASAPPQPPTGTEAPSFAGAVEDTLLDENDSAAYVDRMELADAYDEDAVNLDTDGYTTDAGGGEGTALAAAAAALPPPTTGIPVKDFIDDSTRKVLVQQLKYRRNEVDAMKPEVAAVVAAKRLGRPFEGMPANWYKAGSKQIKSRHPVIQLLPKLVLPVVATALAVTKGPDVVEAIQERRLSQRLHSASRSSVLTKPVAAGAVEVPSPSPSDADSDDDGSEPLVPLEDTPLVDTNEHTTDANKPHPHSIKPKQPPADELDVTWLDKLITAVERRIKAFLHWEI